MDRKEPTPPESNNQAAEQLPPPYTADESFSNNTSSSPATNIQPFPNINYSTYRPPSSAISDHDTTITTVHRPYSKSADELVKLIRQQAALPPKPYVHITGTSNNGLAKDFDLKINLLPYLYRGPSEEPWNYLLIAGPGSVGTWSEERGSTSRRSQRSSQSLEAWAKEYCSDVATVKHFILERKVVNLDIETLSGAIRNFFAELKYHGKLEIKVETAFQKLVVDNQPSKGAGAFFRPLVTAFMGVKSFDVVKAVWPFARTGPSDQDQGKTREYAITSEGQWVKDWKLAIGKAALERRRGWVTTEDRVDAMMIGWAQDLRIKEWGELGSSDNTSWS
jgi:hypothetical protein